MDASIDIETWTEIYCATVYKHKNVKNIKCDQGKFKKYMLKIWFRKLPNILFLSYLLTDIKIVTAYDSFVASFNNH